MKAREHIVRRAAQNVLRAVDDVDDAAVGAAGEEDGFAVLRHQQVLLVAEGVAGIVPADLFAQRGVRLAQELVRPDAGEECQLLVDMPPGTGDVTLSVFQSIPLSGIVVVASPQELVGMVVEKAVKMAEKMAVPIVGLVENMSYLVCPDCGRKIYLFGEGRSAEAAKKHGIPLLTQMPIDPQLAALTDEGRIEEFKGDWLADAVTALEAR